MFYIENKQITPLINSSSEFDLYNHNIIVFFFLINVRSHINIFLCINNSMRNFCVTQTNVTLASDAVSASVGKQKSSLLLVCVQRDPCLIGKLNK